MPNKSYAILGATGHIGSALVQNLLKRGHNVKAIGRDEIKCGDLESCGAEVIVIKDFSNASELAEAFKGVDAVFSFIPPAYTAGDIASYQDKIGEAIKSAIQKNKIHYIVNLSSIGAQLPEKTGIIKDLYRHEQRLNSLSDVHILHLRPGYFMENLLFMIPMIQQSGSLSSPVRGDLPIPMIATKDIANKAAEFLDKLDFKGHTIFELFGPKAITLVEAAKVLGKSINKPDLHYVQLAYQDAEKAMQAMGMKKSATGLMIEMYRGMNEGLIHPTQKMAMDHLGKTTIEEFARTFAQEFKKQIAKEKGFAKAGR